ncbi:acyltransferase [Porticoccaceae bacterium]|nr:acyltransferase [Porticoccaceae bacterium]
MIYSVQFLRGVAAFSVLVYHGSMKAIYFNEDHLLSDFSIGNSGVDLFFIISGFIMFHIASLKQLTPYLFLRARVIRIMPLYWFLSFAALVAYLIAPQLVNSSGGNTDVLASFFLWPTGEKYLINNGWTLTYEFFFYFSFALVLSQTFRVKLISICLFYALLVLAGNLSTPSHPTVVFFTSPILLEFMLGGVVFYMFKNKFLGQSWSLILISVGLLLLLYQNFVGMQTTPLGRFVYYGVPLFLISVGTISLEKKFFNMRPFLRDSVLLLGNISYSLYLVHPFSLVIVYKVCQYMLPSIDANVFLLISVFVSIGASYLVYRVIEKPLIQYFNS